MTQTNDRLAVQPDPRAAVQPTITLLIPTLNEIVGVKTTIPNIDRGLFEHVVVLDGGSTDGTVEHVRSLGIEVREQKRPGLTHAVYDVVKDLKTDYVIEFSPDGNCLVEKLPELVVKLREGFDMVVVSRYLPPARSYDDHLISAFGNHVFSWLIRKLGQFPITDSLNIYRGYRCCLVHDAEVDALLRGPVLEALLSALCNLRGMRMAEIAGDEPKRIAGESKTHHIFNGWWVLVVVFRVYLLKWFGSRT